MAYLHACSTGALRPIGHQHVKHGLRPFMCQPFRPSALPFKHSQRTNRQEELSLQAQLLLSVPSLALFSAGASFAADQAVADADGSAVYAAVSDGGPTDLIVGLMAGTVFVLLVLVTGGIGYLTLRSWLDDRQEKEDRDGPAARSSVVVASSSEPEPEAKKRVRVKREKRGFGSS